MNFSLTQEQELLKDGLEKFLAKNYTVDFKKSLLESKSVSSPQIWDSFREMGLFDLFIPEQYSGFKGGPVELMIIMETFGKFLVSEPFLNSVLSTKIISQGALKWQKDILLSMISKGESIISPAIQEPSFNYLPLNVNLVGNFDGDFWTLNGKKNHIINGSISEKFLTIVRTGNTNSLEKDLTFFIIESDLENLDGKEYPFVDGTRALELEFRDLKITGDAVLGEIGSGYSILQNVLDYGVIASVAESIGILSKIFNLTSTYIRERKQFGLSISQFQVIQHKLVDMYIKVEEAKSMLIMAVSAFDSDEYKVRQKKLSSAKSFVNNALKFTIENAIQLHGGMGVAEEMDLALYVKRGLVLQNLFGDKLFHDKNLVALEKNITSASNLQKKSTKWKKL